MATAKKPAAKAAKKPAGGNGSTATKTKQDDQAEQLEAQAVEAELALAGVVEAATAAGGWLPVQADDCRRHAETIVDARTRLARLAGGTYEPPANLTRWL